MSSSSYLPIGGGTLTGNLISRDIYPDGQMTRVLGSVSSFWKALYVAPTADSQFHISNISVDHLNITNKDIKTTRAGTHGFFVFNSLPLYGTPLANKLFGVAYEAVTISYTRDGGSSWTSGGGSWITSARVKDAFGTSNNTLIVGGATSNDSTSAGVALANSGVGNGIRIEIDLTKENRTGYVSTFSTFIRCYCRTATLKIEGYCEFNNTWFTIEESTKTNTEQTNTTYLSKGVYFEGARKDRETTNNYRCINKLRYTFIVTAADMSGSTLRYTPSIGSLYAFGFGGGSLSTGLQQTASGRTETMDYICGSHLAYTMMRFNSPLQIINFNSNKGLGTVRLGTGTLIISDDFRISDANTEKVVYVQIGNSNKKSVQNNHAEGRLQLYSAGSGHHQLVGTSTDTNYTHYFRNLTGYLTQTSSTSAVGNTTTPVYVDDTGTITAGTELKSAAYYNVMGTNGNVAYSSSEKLIPLVNTDGVMEVGSYIDFHADTTGEDYDIRIRAHVGPPNYMRVYNGGIAMNILADVTAVPIAFGTTESSGTSYTTVSENFWAYIYYYPPYKINSSNTYNAPHFTFRQYSATTSGTRTGNYDNFDLPATSAGKTGNNTYAILTSKNAVTIEQGGTGATTVTGAQTNLGIPQTDSTSGSTSKYYSEKGTWVTLSSASSTVAGITTVGASGGAAAYSHTHSYLPLSGGTLTGNLSLERVSTTDTGMYLYIKRYDDNKTNLLSSIQFGVSTNKANSGIYAAGYWNGTAYTSYDKWIFALNSDGYVHLGGDTKFDRIVSHKITGTGTAAVTTSPYKPALWKFNLGKATPSDGDIITIIIPVAGHGNGVFLSTDNGTTYKPVGMYGNARLTTHFAVNMPITLIYDADGQINGIYPAAGGTATTNVSGGCWRILNFYDANTYTTGYSNTGSSTRDKSVTFSDFALKNSSFVIPITLRNDNSYSSNTIRFNINGTGAKDVYINGAISGSSNNELKAGNYLTYYEKVGTAEKYYVRTSYGALGSLIKDDKLDIAHGGTGATTAAQARSNLGLPSTFVGSPTLLWSFEPTTPGGTVGETTVSFSSATPAVGSWAMTVSSLSNYTYVSVEYMSSTKANSLNQMLYNYILIPLNSGVSNMTALNAGNVESSSVLTRRFKIDSTSFYIDNGYVDGSVNNRVCQPTRIWVI